MKQKTTQRTTKEKLKKHLRNLMLTSGFVAFSAFLSQFQCPLTEKPIDCEKSQSAKMLLLQSKKKVPLNASILGSIGKKGYPERFCVVRALAKIKDATTIPVLNFASKDSESKVRIEAVSALTDFEVHDLLKHKSTMGALLERLYDYRYIADPAHSALKKIIASRGNVQIDASHIPRLLKIINEFKSDDSARNWMANVRITAVRLLGKTDSTAVLPILGDILNDEEEMQYIRKNSAYAIANIGDENGVNHLVRALQTGPGEIQASAAYALGELGCQSAVPHLIDAVKKKSFFARLKERLKFQSDELKNKIRMNVYDALGKLGDSRASGVLNNGQKDEDPDIRAVAAKALESVLNTGCSSVHCIKKINRCL